MKKVSFILFFLIFIISCSNDNGGVDSVVDTNSSESSDVNVSSSSVVFDTIIDTVVLDTSNIDTTLMDSLSLDSSIVDTSLLDTNSVDSNIVDTSVVDTVVKDSVEVIKYLLPFVSNKESLSPKYYEILLKTWSGIKERNIDAYTIPAVHRPHSEIPGDFVSEGIGYGMFLALYSNDQEYFNKIWDAGEQYMWNGSSYNWRCSESGGTLGTGPATDAEEDIACMLIFADKMVEKGYWQPYTSVRGATYKDRAQNILDAFWSYVGPSFNLAPGAWGYDQTNIGYFAPAFYKVFKEFDGNSSHQWDKLIDTNYEIIANNPGYILGLVPDWTDAYGNLLASGPGYNAYDNGQSLYKDAIRVYWRLATDYLWYKDQRAKEFLDNAYNFLKSKGGAEGANFYDMSGNVVNENDVWTEMNGGQTYRSRREHSHLTVGMWACALFVSGSSEDKRAISDELLSFYEGDNYWGHKISTQDYGTDIVGPDGNKFYEDIDHNELYFDQFLAWFGAALISGNWVNVWEELK